MIGVITAYEKLQPNCTKTKVVALKNQLSKDEDYFHYWIDWFGLDKEN